jgi:simple sugar transport system permease protein
MDWSDPVFWEIVLGGMLRLATPVFIAALGEMITEKAGAINLGIDGVMTAGAFAALVFAYLAGWGAGLAGACLVGALYGLLLAVSVIRFNADQIVIGIAISLIGAGLTSYVFQLWQPSGQTAIFVPLVPMITIPGLAEIPFIGSILFRQNALTYAMILVLIAAVYLLNRTRLGLILTAVGENRAAAEMRGVNVDRVRYIAITLGGAFMGLAGAAITLAVLGSYNDGLTNGRGYIALAIVIVGRWTPLGALIGALIFAFFDSLGLRAQSGLAGLPTEAFSALPYLMTIVVLMLANRSVIRRA